ncbi:MAG: hypothetical protein IPM26_04170 [Saprospiraceae bacterium]|nr:hypothetical protein [Saprospiraceae bacterium]
MDLEISWADRIYGVRDVLAINNDQVLILAGGVTYDSIYKEEAFVHWVYRYDLKDRKALWRRNYGHPPSSITPGCRVVASQRDEDTWLMCTSAVLAGSTREHYVIAGEWQSLLPMVIPCGPKIMFFIKMNTLTGTDLSQ